MKLEKEMSRVNLDENGLSRLVTEVKESVAADINENYSDDIFSAADLWSIRKKKSAFRRRPRLVRW